jgi:hypothetical protein
MKHTHEPEIVKVQDCNQQEVKVQLTPDKAHSRLRWNQQSKRPQKLASKPILKTTSWIYMHGVLI